MRKKKQQKYYVVREWNKTGIYSTRDDCKCQVHGYQWAKYKSFETLFDAEQAFSDGYQEVLKSAWKKTSITALVARWLIDLESICVDAACQNNPWILERRGVRTRNRHELFHSKKYPVGTVNIGEWLAIIQWMYRLVKQWKTSWIIYSDSRTAMSWIRQGVIHTTLIRGKNTEILRQSIDAGKKWLKDNKQGIKDIKVVKRKTSEWWEIPADFGRK